ncbi:MAG: polyprenol phosphomannose-dependent alpha 1,6 mannosyltransferase MptB [Jatrophihabitans sp.]
MLKPDRRMIVAGSAGTLLIAISSWWLAGTPASFRTHRPALVSWLPRHSPVASGVFFAGLAIVLLAWLWLGRTVLAEGNPVELRALSVAWATPMLLSMPFGRDLYSYAAQGRLVQLGYHPYRDSPAALPARYAIEVSGRWLHTPAPYGPVWLEISRGINAVAHPHVPLATFLLRVPAFAGVLLTIWLLPRIAERFGLRADRALWLAVANPVTVVLGLGGGHNDLFMVGLVVLGFAVALRRDTGWVALAIGSAVIGLAIVVKFPAALGLAFVVPLWLAGRAASDRLRDAVGASAVAVIAGGVAAGLATALTGLGIGWVHQAGADNSIVNWQSIPTFAGMLANTVSLDAARATELDATIRHARSVGSAVAALVVVALWLQAVRRNYPRRGLLLLGIATVAVVLLGQTFQPWYLFWALPFLGLVAASGRWVTALAAVCIAEAALTMPDGRGLEDRWVAVPVFAGAAALAWWFLGSAGRVPTQRDTDDTRAGVRADDGTHLAGDYLPD